MEHVTSEAFQVLKRAVEILNAVPDMYEKNCEDLKKVDLETLDFLHEIELSEFDEAKGHSILNELKEVRCNRRVIKEDKAVLGFMKDFHFKNGTFVKRLEETVTQMEKEIIARGNRIYTPKVRVDKMEIIYSNKDGSIIEDLHDLQDHHTENAIEMQAF